MLGGIFNNSIFFIRIKLITKVRKSLEIVFILILQNPFFLIITLEKFIIFSEGIIYFSVFDMKLVLTYIIHCMSSGCKALEEKNKKTKKTNSGEFLKDIETVKYFFINKIFP